MAHFFSEVTGSCNQMPFSFSERCLFLVELCRELKRIQGIFNAVSADGRSAQSAEVTTTLQSLAKIMGKAADIGALAAFHTEVNNVFFELSFKRCDLHRTFFHFHLDFPGEPVHRPFAPLF